LIRTVQAVQVVQAVSQILNPNIEIRNKLKDLNSNYEIQNGFVWNFPIFDPLKLFRISDPSISLRTDFVLRIFCSWRLCPSTLLRVVLRQKLRMVSENRTMSLSNHVFARKSFLRTTMIESFPSLRKVFRRSIITNAPFDERLSHHEVREGHEDRITGHRIRKKNVFFLRALCVLRGDIHFSFLLAAEPR